MYPNIINAQNGIGICSLATRFFLISSCSAKSSPSASSDNGVLLKSFFCSVIVFKRIEYPAISAAIKKYENRSASVVPIKNAAAIIAI